MTSKRHAEWDFNPAEPQVLLVFEGYTTSLITHTASGSERWQYVAVKQIGGLDKRIYDLCVVPIGATALIFNQKHT